MSLYQKLFPKKKPKKKGLYIPSFLKRTRTGAQISDERTNQANTDLTSLRFGQTTEEIIRDYAKNSPDVSHALESIMRFAVTDSYTLVAKGLEEDTIDPEATKYVKQLAARMDKLPKSYDGFSSQSSINSTSESLVPELLTNGCCIGELVLDEALLPSHVQAISSNNLKYINKSKRAVPTIKDGGETTVLDSPAICIISLSQDPSTPYSSSWFKAAIQSIISSTEFTNDLRRSFNKASLPRLTAKIDFEKFKDSLSPDVLYDSAKLKTAMNNLVEKVTNELNGLSPEDAVIHYDMVDVGHLAAGNISAHESVKVHAELVNGQVSTGLHVLPSLLGRGASQTVASTETVLFLKIVESLQGRLNEMYSYLFTMAARLQGHDVSVSFTYKKPSLRPEVEEESFITMKQSRILEQLSLGLISDEEASITLTGDLPSGDFTPLSGTGFHQPMEPVENPTSNTSVTGKGVNDTKDQKDRKQTDSNPKTNSTTG